MTPWAGQGLLPRPQTKGRRAQETVPTLLETTLPIPFDSHFSAGASSNHSVNIH